MYLVFFINISLVAPEDKTMFYQAGPNIRYALLPFVKKVFFTKENGDHCLFFNKFELSMHKNISNTSEPPPGRHWATVGRCLIFYVAEAFPPCCLLHYSVLS